MQSKRFLLKFEKRGHCQRKLAGWLAVEGLNKDGTELMSLLQLKFVQQLCRSGNWAVPLSPKEVRCSIVETNE